MSMKNILIIRHGESTSNAGEQTQSHDTIPLTEKGRQQAQELAETLHIQPDLIVISSYSRTNETALPYCRKHPTVPVEVWNVHEFTFLPSTMYAGTTREDRRHAALHYWEHAHPKWKASEDAESFYELTKRIELFVEHARSRPEETIVIFSHGRFILALQLYLEKCREYGTNTLPDEAITELKLTHAKGVLTQEVFPIDNASVHRITL